MSIQQNEQARTAIRRLIADLIDEEPTIYKMGEYTVFPDDIKVFEGEYEVLRAIFELDGLNKPPTAENVKTFLQGLNKSTDALDEIISMRSPYRDIHGVAMLIKDTFVRQRKTQTVLTEITRIVNSNLLPREIEEKIYGVVHKYISGKTRQRVLDQEKALSSFEKEMERRAEMRKLGIPIGPSWPYTALRALVPRMRKGDLHSIMGKTKFGKTTLGMALSEYWAYTQGYDVHVLLFETTPMSWISKQITANTLIPLAATENAFWNPGDGSKADQIYQKWKKFVSEKKGSITYVPSPGWGMAQIEAYAKAAQAISEANGKEAVFLIDYYQLIEDPDMKSDTERCNRIAHKLKEMSQVNNMWLMVLVQEQEGDSSGDLNSRIYPKHGNEIIKQSQLFMRIRRFAGSGKQAVIDAEGKQLLDVFDTPRLWSDEESYDSYMELQVIAANNDARGTCPLRFEQAMGRISETKRKYTP
jgi:replicative DNA helicase